MSKVCYIYVNIRCIVPLLDYEKLLVPGLHSGWLSAHVYCEYDNVTSGINCLLFFSLSQIWGEGGSCMQNAITSFVCRLFRKYILLKSTMAECNQEGCEESDLYGGSIWWFTSLNFEQMMVKVKFVESESLFSLRTLSSWAGSIWFLYVTQLPSPVWLVRNDTESEWNSQVAIVTVCCSVEVHVSHLKLKTERQGDVKKKKKREGEKAREAVWASEQRKVISIFCLRNARLFVALQIMIKPYHADFTSRA